MAKRKGRSIRARIADRFSKRRARWVRATIAERHTMACASAGEVTRLWEAMYSGDKAAVNRVWLELYDARRGVHLPAGTAVIVDSEFAGDVARIKIDGDAVHLFADLYVDRRELELLS